MTEQTDLLEKRKSALASLGFSPDPETGDMVFQNHRFSNHDILSFSGFDWALSVSALKRDIQEAMNREIRHIEAVTEHSAEVKAPAAPINYPCKMVQSNSEYHSANGFISSTVLKQYRVSPLHAKYAMTVKKEQTAAMRFGSAYHTLVLEPHLFESEYFIINLEERPYPENNMNNKANRLWKENLIARNFGKDMITLEEYNTMLAMKEVLMANKTASFLLTNGIPEMSYYFDVNGVKCKVRPDNLKKKCIADLKTGEDVSPKGFSRQCADYGYHISAFMYLLGVSIVDGVDMLPFYFVAQEKKEPYAVGVYLASDAFIGRGQQDFFELLNTHKGCTESNYWPGYEHIASNERGVLNIDLPNWY